MKRSKHIIVFLVSALVLVVPITLIASMAPAVEIERTHGEGAVKAPLSGEVVKLKLYEPKKTIVKGIITAYTSIPELTDLDPFTTASGQNVRVGIVANNCAKFGTRVFIDGKMYEVQDRKNARYSCAWWDLYMPTLGEAKLWGKQIKEVTIIE